MTIARPDEQFTTLEAAEYLGKSQRTVQRLLVSKELHGEQRNGEWTITALALWRFLGIEEDMKDLWVRALRDRCRKDNENS